MTVYRARTVLTLVAGQPPLDDGAVAVGADGRIAAAGRWPELRRDLPGSGHRVVDLGEQVLLPGLINAHCHLDYGALRGGIPPPEHFTAWIGQINALKRSLGPADYAAGIVGGAADLRRQGVTSVVNLAAFPELTADLAPLPLRVWWCWELIDVRGGPLPLDALAARAERLRRDRPDAARGGWGWCPHAPYTASAALYRQVAVRAAAAGDPGAPARPLLTTHLGESRDEQLMFTAGEGPLHAFLAGLGRPTDDCGRGRSALGTLAASGALGPDWIVAHLNELTSEDLGWLAPGGGLHGLPVVHCPSSHRYFRHHPFAWADLRTRGVNLCVGTDSLASTDALDLWGELRLLGSGQTLAGDGPPPGPGELLEAVTTHPARALGRENQLGRLVPGAWADLVARSAAPGATRTLDDVAAALLTHSGPVGASILQGELLPPESLSPERTMFTLRSDK